MDAILIVDDNRISRQIARDTLAGCGFTVREATGPEQALEMVEREDPNVVLLEVVLPGWSGIEVLRWIRDRHPRTNVVMMTGYASIDLAVRAIQLGAYDFISKPLRIEELVVTVRKALDNFWLSRERDHLIENLERMVSERTRALDEARAALVEREKMASLGRLAAGVAHEINNPLAYISSNLESLGEVLADLARSPAGPAVNDALLDAQALLVDSVEGSRRIRRIVRSLREFSATDREEPVPADLNEEMEKSLRLVSNELKHRAQVDCRLEPLPSIRCHPTQLGQVFVNLLVNAVQAIAERGTIRVRSGSTGEEAFFEVSDDGCGIPPENLGRIFDPFFSTKPVGQGTGLGLSVSFGIVRGHGGRIEVESAPGDGSRFTVWIPLAGIPPEEGPAAPLPRREDPSPVADGAGPG